MRRLLASLATAATLCSVAQAGTVAYDITAGTFGNQAFGDSLGMDFDIRDASGVTITDVGVFDSGSDGLNGPLNVAIYDRTTGTIVPGSQATLNGTDGTAMGGHRFANLTSPINLPGGFQGSIVAFGYNGAEMNGNGGLGQTTAGLGTIEFVGASRWGSDTGFPTNIDSGPANRYAAGSFIFDLIPDVPGTANALQVASGTAGTQAFGGALGIDFIVTNPIEVSSLGAFDSLGDGISGTLTTELWSHSGGTPGAILGSATFTGSGDPLAGGHRYSTLGTPLLLAPGEYSIVSHGYTATDMNGNIGTGSSLNTWDDQNDAIDFVGASRFGNTPGAFPDQVDGRNAQYHAGSFQYTVVPEPSAAALLGLGALALLFRRRSR